MWEKTGNPEEKPTSIEKKCSSCAKKINHVGDIICF